MNVYSLSCHATDAERRRFVIKVARRCEHFLRKAAAAEDQGHLQAANDFRRLAELQSADAFEALK